MEKRGQGLSVNAIILIVLGVFILAMMIVGFTLGWGKIAPWISTNNVDTIVNSCATACATNSQYNYCTVERDLKDAEGNEVTASCDVLATSEGNKKYGVVECPAIPCPNSNVRAEDTGPST